MIEDPLKALEAGLWIKTALMKADDGSASYDCRMAIGIRKVTFMAGTTLEYDGEVLRHSGPALGAMTQDKSLRVVTPWGKDQQAPNVTLHHQEENCVEQTK